MLSRSAPRVPRCAPAVLILICAATCHTAVMRNLNLRSRFPRMVTSGRDMSVAFRNCASHAKLPGRRSPDCEKMETEMEALIYHFKIVTEGFTVPAGEVYQAIESPRGEMGYYVVSDGTAKPMRVHMRSPSYANLQALPQMCEGRLIADVVAAIGSIDIVLGEIDR